MLVNKGSASLLDVLFLGLFISLLLVVGSYFGNDMYRAEVVREEVLYTDSVLISLMNYRNDSIGDFDKITNLSIAEAIDMFYCEGDVSQYNLNKTIDWFLEISVKKNYNYIFWMSNDDGRGVHLWRGQATVCASHITVKSFDHKLSCDDSVPVMINIWPEWKEIPENCSSV
jgi:hypothetical protein